MHTKLGSTKIIFIDERALIFRELFIESFYIILYNHQYKQKKNRCPAKNPETPSLSGTEESLVNQNSFRVLSILYITNFCETKKI